MRLAKLLVGGHSLAMRDLTIESHDRSEGFTLRNESQLSGCKVMTLALVPHLLLFDFLQILFEQVLNTDVHNEIPNILSVVENAGIFLLLLSRVEVTSQKRNDHIFKEPL